VQSARAERATSEYLDERGLRVLETLGAVAKAHRTTIPAVALVWLLARPTVVAPIASARTREQLSELLPVATLRRTPDEVRQLTAALDA
jgi:aryl-alcohol dehydrogenase-like predicted oxidoreductase